MNLDLGDDGLNLGSGLLRALGELAHLSSYHGEPTAVLTCPSRLNRGIEREQICLLTQLIDELQNPSNFDNLFPRVAEDDAIS